MSKLFHETSDQGTGSVTLKVEDITGDHVLTLPPQSGALASLGAGGMPQTADGTPVVASGSNNDGEWTKLGDGTLLMKAAFSSITTTGTGSYVWQYPVTMVGVAYSEGGLRVFNNTARFNFQRTVYGTEENSAGFYMTDENNSPLLSETISTMATFFGIGRWKA